MSNQPRGASAAHIIIGDDVVTKLDTAKTGSRVRRQGVWLYDYAGPFLPEVTRVTSQGYEMRRYVDVDVDQLIDDPMTMLTEIWAAYHDRIRPDIRRQYALNPFVALDPAALDSYVIDLCRLFGAPTVGMKLLELRRQIAWPSHPTALTWTHGDLILDNVMRDAEGKLILIDAIPPCPALPSLAIVDFGRLIQSAAGYEQMRYNGTTPKDDVWQDRVATVVHWVGRLGNHWHTGYNTDAVHGALFYSVIHMLRGARTDPVNRSLMVDQARNLLEELETWMR